MAQDCCIRRLTTSPLFHDIEYNEAIEILSYLNPRAQKYKKNEIVTFSEPSYDGIGIVARGKIAITSKSSSGNRVILDIMETGDVFGERIAFSYSKKCPLTIVAQEESCVFFLPLNKLVGNYNNLGVCNNILTTNLLKLLSDYTLLLNKKINYLSEKSLRSKLCMYFIDLYQKTGRPNLIMSMKRHELADYLNVSRPALSKELGLMRDEGIIDFGGSSITILNIKLLEEFI